MPPSKRARRGDAQLSVVPPARDPRHIADALSDPARADVFEALGWLATATAEDIAQFMSIPSAQAAEHLAVLEAHDLVEPIADAPGGSPPYRATRESLITDEEWAEFPRALRRRLLARMLDKMDDRVRSALRRGGFDAADVHVSWMPTDLDGIGYQDIVRLLAETLHRAGDIQAAAVERRASGAADEESVRSEIMLLHFRHEAEDVEPEQEEATRPLVERMHELADAIGDQMPRERPDWHRVAEDAAALAVLASRRAGATVL